MDHKIFSIYDQKAHAYLPPFILPRTEMALRTFSECANAPDHQFYKHPGDFTLVEIGGFDDSSGRISPYDVLISIGTALEFKTARQINENQLDAFAEENKDDDSTLGDDTPVQPSTERGNSAELLRQKPRA